MSALDRESGHVQCISPCPLWARSGHVGAGTNHQNPRRKSQDQVNLYGIAGLTNNKLKSQMTKLLILILVLKIAVVVVVGIACGALILRFIFEVGATQTTPNSRSQQWGPYAATDHYSSTNPRSTPPPYPCLAPLARSRTP